MAAGPEIQSTSYFRPKCDGVFAGVTPVHDVRCALDARREHGLEKLRFGCADFRESLSDRLDGAVVLGEPERATPGVRLGHVSGVAQYSRNGGGASPGGHPLALGPGT